MNSRPSRRPSSGWQKFLKRHELSIWACDFFCVQTILFQTLHAFFVIRHVNREILHVAMTPFPTAERSASLVPSTTPTVSISASFANSLALSRDRFPGFWWCG
jgi:hypothetical protein